MLRGAADRHNLKLVSEVMDLSQIELIEKYADILQVGARNMQNFTLLRELGRTRTPIMLKRGISATIEEWLLSAEYILAGGNINVMLCERGIRTFESYTRNTLDISAIPVIHKRATCRSSPTPATARAARHGGVDGARRGAAGADGLIIEVHVDPDHALSDGAQSLFPSQFDRLMAELRIIAPAIGRASASSLWRAEDGESDQPPFPRVAIVGFGLIGGSIALAVKRRWPAITIAAVDRTSVIKIALETRIIDDGSDRPAQASPARIW